MINYENILITIASFIVPLIIFGICFLKYKYSYWENKGVWSIKPNPWNPFGNITLGVHFSDMMEALYKKIKPQGSIGGIYFGPGPGLIITDLDLIKTILIKDFKYFTDHGNYVNEVDDPISANLFSLGGEKWRKMRNNLSPTFTSGRIKQMYHTVSDKGEGFIKLLNKFSETGEPFDAKEVTQRFIADVISSAAFGFEANAMTDENPRMLEVADNLLKFSFTRMVHLMFTQTCQKLAKALHFTQFPKEVSDFFMGITRDVVQYREENDIHRQDFINMLISLKNRGTINDSDPVNEDGKLTFNEIAAQAFIFFFAGFDTSSTAVQFALYYLAKDSEIQERLRNEVRTVKAKYGNKLTYDALVEMQYLTQVFNEALRLFPPLGLVMRVANDDYKIPNTDVVIEKGIVVMVPMHGIQRDPEYFPDPMKFDPDRFSPERVAERHPCTFLPFSDGPRSCIGMRFAQIQSKFSIATVVDNFELSVNPRTQEPVQLDSSSPHVLVKGGIWLDIKKL